MIMIYMLACILIGTMIKLIIQYYTLPKGQLNNNATYDMWGFCYKSVLIGMLNMLLWCFIWKLEGIHLYSTFLCIVTSLLLIISVIDIKCMIIPDSLTLSIFFIGIFFILFGYIEVWHALLGFISVSSILYMIYVFTKQKGIGGGDIKLMATCGLLLGVQKSILALEIACILALMIQGFMGFIKSKQAFAFGPYLSIGIFLSLLIGDFIIQTILLLA